MEINQFGFLLNINGSEIIRANQYEYLGIIIDDRLNWSNHVDKIRKEITPYVFILNRSRYLISEQTAKLIYQSFIHSRLTYVAPSWRAAPDYKLQELRVLQHRAIKAIYRLPFLTPSRDLFSPTLLSLNNILKYETILTIFKIKHNLIRNSQNLRLVSDTHHHNTRQGQLYYIEPSVTTVADSNIFRVGLQMFNCLPQPIREECLLGSFKKKLRDYLSD